MEIVYQKTYQSDRIQKELIRVFNLSNAAKNSANPFESLDITKSIKQISDPGSDCEIYPLQDRIDHKDEFINDAIRISEEEELTCIIAEFDERIEVRYTFQPYGSFIVFKKILDCCDKLEFKIEKADSLSLLFTYYTHTLKRNGEVYYL